MEEKRSQWSSGIGFLLAAIGSAIGMGNLWGFPYKMGANGGMPFLVMYLIMVILCGVICMGVEMAIGRKTGKSPILAMATLGKTHKIWGIFGTFCAFLIMGFYTMLVGYAFRYFVGFFVQIFGADGFAGATSGTDFFVAFTYNVPSVLLYTGIAFLVAAIIVASGVEGGLEKFNKVGMPALFGILIIIIVYNFVGLGVTEKGSAFDGLKFMFTAQGMEIAGTNFDFFKALRAAGGQMLFSLSIGMGIMTTYGSYMKKDQSIAKNAWLIPMFDTLAALMAGLAIFPAVFATGNSVNAGPGLLYITMQDVCTTMGKVGNFIGALFYLLVIFAGVSSLISLLEVVTSSILDSLESKGVHMNRKKAALLVAVAEFVISIPVCLDKLGLDGADGFFYPLYQFLGSGSQDLLDVYDLITEGLLMPLGACAMCLIIGWDKGFDFMASEVEINGEKWRCKRFFNICIRYITPVLMLFVFVSLFLSYLGI